jgi:hypothetical protein
MQNEIINQIELKYVLRESNDEVELEIDYDDSEMNKDFLKNHRRVLQFR